MELNTELEWTMAYDRDGELRVVAGAGVGRCIHDKAMRSLEPARYLVEGSRVRCAACWFEARAIARGAPERLPLKAPGEVGT